MSYTAKDIRNIALLGHGGDGKTMLAEDMLYLTHGSDRLGSIADGNTVSDFDPEEIKRQNSISTSLIPVEFEGCKINVLDNPGVFDFAGEIVQSLRVADAGLIVLSAKGGIAVGTEKAWKSMKDAGKPTMFYISKMDEDHANYFKVVDEGQNWVGMNDGYKAVDWTMADPESSDGNFSVTADEPIIWLTIDTKKKEVYKEAVSKVGLIGGFNGWSEADEPSFTYNVTDNVWESPVIAFTAGQGWKFRLNKTAWYGDAGPSSEIEGGIATTAQASGNIAAPGTGNYIVKVHGNRTPFVIEYVQQ